MRKYVLLAVPLALLLTGAQAQAAAIQVGSIVSNDSFDWGQYADGVPMGSPIGATSALLRTGTLSDGGAFTGLVEGTSWFGNFAVGDNVLFTGDASDLVPTSDSFEMAFDTPVAGLGLQITSNLYGAFTAALEVFSGATSLGSFSVGGTMDGSEDGLAPFLGALSDAVDIDRAVFTLTSNNGFGLGVNRLLTTDTPNAPNPIPEPATLGLLGAGLAAVLLRRRQRR